ncbi:DUF6979 family protein [Paenibacillus endoradicis]|uniref:DUF6979 family protein n=1 Tax=Paenibacillus endoradicis TaxID=2972487 RepID=UPI002159B0FD|nr:hypothetical protein [Paenibacillus endoradicis]MCR8659324.1 hypothetical protein [Paenibacillus endoradicis]
MNKYGAVAVGTVQLISEGNIKPLNAWKTVSSAVLGEGTWMQRKGCPKNAFLGLCEEGLVQGVHKGSYAEKRGSQKNKNYAIQAVQILKEKPDLADDKLKLWREVINGVEISHNSQMDVVLALWNNTLIVSE